MAKATRHKVRISGNVVEHWEFTKPIFLEGNNGGGRKKSGEPKSEKSEEYRVQNRRKSKDKFMSLVSHNFTDGDKFITLTFRDTDEFDIRNVKDTNKEFKKFMQRLRYKYGKFKYIGVIEFQDENKRGAVHYHFIANLGYVPADTLAEIWGLGYIGINRIQGVDNIGAYVSKYMAKDMTDKRLEGKKNYLPSRNLEEPIILYGKTAKDMIDSISNDGEKKEAFRNSYDSEYFGETTYKQYNRNRETVQITLGKREIEKAKKIAEIDDYLNLIGFESTIDKAEKLLEDIKNGKVTHNRRILEDVYRREKKNVRGRRDWGEISKRLLECLPETGETDDGAEWREYQTSKEYWEEFVRLTLSTEF